MFFSCLRNWSYRWCVDKVLADELQRSVQKKTPPISQNMSEIQRNYNCTHKLCSDCATAEKIDRCGIAEIRLFIDLSLIIFVTRSNLSPKNCDQ